jgi:pyrroloquinoline-quinone synthase
MKPEAVLVQLDRLIESRSILEHPFYVAWTHGDLTRDQLSTYAAAYYPHVAAFPGYLRAAADAADDPVVRAELLRNLDDEISRPKPHGELWLDFASGLGLDRAAVASEPPRAYARNAVDTFKRLTSGSSAPALAALYAYESQQPGVSRQKADGLLRLYGVGDPEALRYFEVHAEADVRHREGERAALRRCLEAGAPADVALGAAEGALVAYWGLLSGICEEAKVAVGER